MNKQIFKIFLTVIIAVLALFIGIVELAKYKTDGGISYKTIKIFAPKYFGMRHINQNIYFTKDLPLSYTNAIIAKYNDATNRVQKIFGSVTADFKVLVFSDQKQFQKFGMGSPLASAYYFTVLIKTNSFSIYPNVLAHEFAHAEIFSRIGIVNQQKLPRWFDEGLAEVVGFTNAERFTRSYLTERQKKYNLYPTLDDLRNNRGFNEYSKIDPALGYTTAYLEVSNWYQGVGQRGLISLLSKLKEGEAFSKAYSNLLKIER